MGSIRNETFESRVPEGNRWLVFLVRPKGQGHGGPPVKGETVIRMDARQEL